MSNKICVVKTYPGGRKVAKRVPREWVQSPDEAAASLDRGEASYVSILDIYKPGTRVRILMTKVSRTIAVQLLADGTGEVVNISKYGNVTVKVTDWLLLYLLASEIEPLENIYADV